MTVFDNQKRLLDLRPEPDSSEVVHDASTVNGITT